MENKVVESSVQVKDSNYWKSTILRLAAAYDIIPEWWSPRRDAFFRGYWYQENFLASAIYAIANRNAAFGWTLTGLEEDVQNAQQLLQYAEFGEGWQNFIIKTTIDLLTTDNGAFVEVIRPAKVKINGGSLPAVKEYYENDVAEWYAIDAKGKRIKANDYTIYDSPLDLPIGVAHLDSGQCTRTGDPDTPVVYTDTNGKKHALKWWQVLTFTDMPSPIEKMNGVGYSSLSRVFRASHIMQSISLYNDEKIGGRFNRAVFLTNVDPDTINDAIMMSESDADNRGLLRYSAPIVAATLNPETPVSLETINLAEIPDGFDMDNMNNWYIANLALALGVDYGFLAPLPGKGLGTASQSETMERQARGKSSRLFMDMMSNAINFKGVLPPSVQFRFTETDAEEEERVEKSRKARADRLQIYSEMGWVTTTVAQQMLSDAGDIPQVYLDQMGQEDTTPVITTEGDENVDAVEEQQNELEKVYKRVKEEQKLLFKRKTIFEHIKNAARKTFGKKQVAIPEIEDGDLQNALENYAAQLEELVLRANSGEVTQEDFEAELAELVALALTGIYSEMSGTAPEDFTEDDQAILEDYLDVNMESVEKLSDDIYDDRYQDTEDREGVLMLLGRLGLWVTNAYALATVAMVMNDANAEKRYKFLLGATADHCSSCISLNGQVHTASEWAQHPESLPRSHDLECKGYNCLCTLVETNDPVSGSF